MAPRAHLSPYPNDTFKPHQVREEKDLIPFADDPVVAYIANTCPGVHYVGNTLVGPPSRMGSRMNMNRTDVPINIYLNGFQVSQQDIEGLMVSDIDCLVYIDGMDATKYDTAFTSLDYAVRRSPPVVLISSRFTVRIAPNVTADRPLGWQKPARASSRCVPHYIGSPTSASRTGKPVSSSTLPTTKCLTGSFWKA